MNVATHTFEISVCDSELMKVRHAERHFGKLWVVKAHKYRVRGKCTVGLTKHYRLVCGFDLMYSVTFPLGIPSEMMRKYWGSFDQDTPNRGKIFG